MKDLKFQQIVVRQWDNGSGLNGCIVGLSVEGDVYEYRSQKGWEPLLSKETPATPKKKPYYPHKKNVDTGSLDTKAPF